MLGAQRWACVLMVVAAVHGAEPAAYDADVSAAKMPSPRSMCHMSHLTNMWRFVGPGV